MSYTIVKHKDYQNDKVLIDKLNDVIGESYAVAGHHIQKDLDICNELYCIYDADDTVLAFFMIGYHAIQSMNCCYLGLSACRQAYKNSGYVKALYFEFARDCMKKEVAIDDPILCYWTTATPIVYHWFEKNFKKVQPDRNGKCTITGKALLNIIAESKYANAQFNSDTPFILRHAAKQINYSANESSRIRQAITDLDLKVFDLHQLDETNGDRFLMCGYAPDC